MARRSLTGTLYRAARLSTTGRAVRTACAGRYTLALRGGNNAIIIGVTVH